jgi:hypothetical protein
MKEPHPPPPVRGVKMSILEFTKRIFYKEEITILSFTKRIFYKEEITILSFTKRIFYKGAMSILEFTKRIFYKGNDWQCAWLGHRPVLSRCSPGRMIRLFTS